MYFPLGLMYIASAINLIGGHEVEILDIFGSQYSNEDVTRILKYQSWDIIGINAFSTQYSYFKWIAEECKKRLPDGLLIAGGPLATYSSKTLMSKTAIDVCVLGEGEDTISSILQNSGSFSGIPGICYKSGDKSISEKNLQYIKDIDNLPFPDYDLLPTKDIYFHNLGITGATSRRNANVITSRGCPYSCGFCSKTIKRSRIRTVDSVIEEIQTLKEKFGITGVGILDELAITSKERGYEICEKIKPLKLYWDCQCRANLVDYDLFRAMKNAGCTAVGLGVESGSQKILDAMKKKTTVRQNEEAIQNARKAGLQPVVQMIYGYQGEDHATVNDTIEMFNRIHFYPPFGHSECNFNLMTPLPGSPIYEELVSSGRITAEEDYLMLLDSGYYIDSPLLINVSNFNDEELLEAKNNMEDQILRNYREYARYRPLERIRNLRDAFTSMLIVEGPFVTLKYLYTWLIKKAAKVLKFRVK